MKQPTDAYQLFTDTLHPPTEPWRDGDHYPVDLLKMMTLSERKKIFALFPTADSQNITWREVELFQALDLPAARRAIKAATQHHLSIDTRLAATAIQHDAGKLKDQNLEAALCKEIRQLSDPHPGLDRALQMAQDHPTEKVKQALLWASLNATDCAPRCAAMLCYLTGNSSRTYDEQRKPFFDKFGLHNSYFTRQAAFDELCEFTKMQLDTSQSN